MVVPDLLSIDFRAEKMARAQESLKSFVRQSWHIVEPATPFIDGWHIDALCEHLEAVSRGDIKLLLINMPPRHMKCAIIGSMILMSNGLQKSIEQVSIGDEVVSSDGVSVTNDRVMAVWSSGYKHVVKITLSDGRVIQATPDHRLYGWDSWVHVRDLRVGDPLCVVEQTQPQSGDLSEDDAFLLALWLAEGDKTGSGFLATNGLPEIRLQLEGIASSRNWKVSELHSLHRPYAISLTMGGKKLGDTPSNFLRKYKLKDDSSMSTANIGVPEEIWKANNNVIARFLSVFIACDGCIAKQSRAVVIEAKSERMVRDLQLLATRFGVRATVSSKTFYQDEIRRDAWIWQVSGSHSLRILGQILDIPGKQADLEELISILPERTAERSIPPVWRNSLKWSAGWHRLRGLRVDKPGWTDKRKAIIAAQQEGNCQLYNKLTSGLGWRQIVAIEDVGEVETFDLETEQYHAYFLDTVLSHNSLLVSVMWPMWEWTTKPHNRWMFSSYALSLAIRDSLKSRRLIESGWYQTNWGQVFTLAKDQNLKSRFENDKRGYRLAVSVGSAATGEGADKIICDDAHNMVEAESKVIREGTLDWWDTTMSSRINNPKTGAKVVVMQRVHAEDLSGHILNQGGYIHLRLPAEYEPHDKCVTAIGWEDPRTKEGELLWPARFTQEALNDIKRSLGSVGYAGQYQQRPVPSGGSIFKKSWIRYFTQDEQAYTLEEPDTRKRFLLNLCHLFVTVDLAISQKQTADYTVIAVWAVTPDRELLLIDRLRDRFDNPEQQKQLQLIYQRYHPDYISIENVAYQLAIIQQLRRLGLPIREYKPVKDKVSRASTASVFYEGGRVYHPKGVSWLQEWEDELLMFPMGAHDDQVDTLSIACDAICGPTANASEQIEAMKRRAQLAQLRTAMPAKVVPGWPG